MGIASMVNGAIGEMVWAAEQYYSIDRHTDVAIDIIYVTYYDIYKSSLKRFTWLISFPIVICYIHATDRL